MGRAANKIKKRNDLKEVILNKKGKPVYQKVRAEYATFHRTNKASVTVEVLIKDLRENQPNLFEKRVNKSEYDKKSYYTWSGDERALASRSDITRLGTDQSAPVSSRRLARRAWTKLLKELSAEIIDTLEN